MAYQVHVRGIEMSTDDGETWEKVQMPMNSHPFDQVKKYGTYTETTAKGTAVYRNARR